MQGTAKKRRHHFTDETSSVCLADGISSRTRSKLLQLNDVHSLVVDDTAKRPISQTDKGPLKSACSKSHDSQNHGDYRKRKRKCSVVEKQSGSVSHRCEAGVQIRSSGRKKHVHVKFADKQNVNTRNNGLEKSGTIRQKSTTKQRIHKCKRDKTSPTVSGSAGITGA